MTLPQALFSVRFWTLVTSFEHFLFVFEHFLTGYEQFVTISVKYSRSFMLFSSLMMSSSLFLFTNQGLLSSLMLFSPRDYK